MGSPRDFRAELRDDKCWDHRTQEVFEQTGIPLDDCILQNREELIGLCELIEREGVRSYLEIGVWTGRLVSTLHRLFDFDLVAACDTGAARALGLPMRLPFGCELFEGSSLSRDYLMWRQALGPVDLVLIDGDHGYDVVRLDWERNRHLPNRLLVFHDITGANPTTTGVKRFWDELEGPKETIVRPHRELDLPYSTMGLGIWRVPDPS